MSNNRKATRGRVHKMVADHSKTAKKKNKDGCLRKIAMRKSPTYIGHVMDYIGVEL